MFGKLSQVPSPSASEQLSGELKVTKSPRKTSGVSKNVEFCTSAASHGSHVALPQQLLITAATESTFQRLYAWCGHTELAVLPVPAARAVAAAGDGVARGSVETVARLETAGSVVEPVARHVALVAAEADATLALAAHRVADGVASTLAVTGAVLAVAAASARCTVSAQHPCTPRSHTRSPRCLQ